MKPFTPRPSPIVRNANPLAGFDEHFSHRERRELEAKVALRDDQLATLQEDQYLLI
jgi:hypothetical protein